MTIDFFDAVVLFINDDDDEDMITYEL